MLDSHRKGRRNNEANATRCETYMRSKLLTFCCSSCISHHARFLFSKTIQTAFSSDGDGGRSRAWWSGVAPKIWTLVIFFYQINMSSQRFWVNKRRSASQNLSPTGYYPPSNFLNFKLKGSQNRIIIEHYQVLLSSTCRKCLVHAFSTSFLQHNTHKDWSR